MMIILSGKKEQFSAKGRKILRTIIAVAVRRYKVKSIKVNGKLA